MTLDDDDGRTCFMLFHFFLCAWDNKCGVRFCRLENLQQRFTYAIRRAGRTILSSAAPRSTYHFEIIIFPVRSTSLGRAGGEFLEKQDLLPLRALEPKW